MDIVIPNATSIGVFSLAAVLLLLTPGPRPFSTSSRASVEQGRIAGLASVLRYHNGERSYMCLGGGAGAVSAAGFLSACLRSRQYVGAGYLIYIGALRILSRNDTPAAQIELPRRSLGRLYRDGFVVNLLNPKTALFFLAFLPHFVDPSRGAVAFPDRLPRSAVHTNGSDE